MVSMPTGQTDRQTDGRTDARTVTSRFLLDVVCKKVIVKFLKERCHLNVFLKIILSVSVSKNNRFMTILQAPITTGRLCWSQVLLSACLADRIQIKAKIPESPSTMLPRSSTYSHQLTARLDKNSKGATLLKQKPRLSIWPTPTVTELLNSVLFMTYICNVQTKMLTREQKQNENRISFHNNTCQQQTATQLCLL